MNKKQLYSDLIEILNPFNAYRNDRDMNLVKMILNLTHNNSNDYQKPVGVYQTYYSMSEMGFAEKVKESIQNSERVMCVPLVRYFKLKQLVENDSKSFLALPLLGKGHLWSVLIRKTDEGYSAMVINKGLRFWHDPVEEFVFSKKNRFHLVNLEKCLFAAGTLGMENIEDIYRAFISSSDHQYNLKINAGPQKVGNCFTKNIQAAIKIAAATSDFSSEKIRQLRMSNPYSSVGTNVANKVTFKWKGFETEKMQIMFVNKIAQKNPRIRKKVDEAIKIYSFNKRLRENFKQQMNPINAVNAAFVNHSEIENLDEYQKCKAMLRLITPYNLAGYHDKIGEIVQSTKNAEYGASFNDIVELSKLGTYMTRSIYMSIFMEGRHDVLQSIYRVFDRNNSFANLEDKERIKEVLKNVDIYSMNRYGSEIKSACKKVYGDYEGRAVYRAAESFAQTKMKTIMDSWRKNMKRLKVLEDDFPLVVESICYDLSDAMRHNSKFKNRDVEISNMTIMHQI